MIGLDYASVDGNPPPDFVRADASFVYIRGTWGTYVDPNLARDLPAARAVSPAGAYMFLRFPELGHPAPAPEDQVAAFVGAYGEIGLNDLPPALDVEFPGRGRVDTGLSVDAALDWIGRALGALQKEYRTVMVYTSARVWEDDLLNHPAALLGDCPLWVKTPYVRRARSQALVEYIVPGSALAIPPPWHGAAWIQQYQGDAVNYPGFAGTVDLNRFLPALGGATGMVANTDPRAGWVHARLRGRTIRDFQDECGLVVDGVIGPRTFAALCQAPV